MCKQIYLAGAILALGPLLCGCHTLRYYKQAVVGQMQILSHELPIEKLVDDPDTSPLLREKLELVLEIRQFAAKELHLRPNGHYLHYADLGRHFVVWNVHAAPEFSLQPKTWWYPIVGRLKYQGYFSEDEANGYARTLEQEGYDVFVGGVHAYSTLGWFRDPVLNTFVFDTEANLAELLFHELAHQRAFAKSDTDFNEAFATAVAEEGLRRWMQTRWDVRASEEYRAGQERKERFVELVSKTRERLKQLYGEADQHKHTPEGGARPILSDSAKRVAKERLFAELRRDYEELKGKWGGADDYGSWFQKSLSNAKLNTVETYYGLVPAFQRMLRAKGDDLEKFYREVKALAALPKVKRHQRLAEFFSKNMTGVAEPETSKLQFRDAATPHRQMCNSHVRLAAASH